MLAGADLMNVWPTPHLGTVTVLRSPAQPSALILPVAPPREAPLPEPGLRPSPHPPARREELAAPELSQSRDLIRDTATVAYSLGYTTRWGNQARYTVSARDPAVAVAEGNSRATWSYAGREIVVQAHCMTTSDARAFYHTTQVEITVDGRPFRTRSWAVSVPREGI
ncbi:MAG: hypothetical protein HYU66_19995 [Armatimonadetes bacterium]|nr:hypothetical protein [Armatimonadota bacterium]